MPVLFLLEIVFICSIIVAHGVRWFASCSENTVVEKVLFQLMNLRP